MRPDSPVPVLSSTICAFNDIREKDGCEDSTTNQSVIIMHAEHAAEIIPSNNTDNHTLSTLSPFII